MVEQVKAKAGVASESPSLEGRAFRIVVAIVLEPTLRGQASEVSRIEEVEPREVIPYRGGRAAGGYPVSRRSSVGRLFRIEPGGPVS